MAGKNRIPKKSGSPAEKKKIPVVLRKEYDINERPVIENFKTNYIIYAIIFIFTFGIYFNSIFNNYALDDAIVITQNDFTQKGFSGIKDIFTTELFTGFFKVKKDLVAGGRYRPLSMLTFAIEFELIPAGIRPHFSHLINVILFSLNNILIFIILLRLFRRFPSKKWYLSLPFIAAMLYAAHPIHTEVVACVKGRDDILAFGGSLLSIYFSFKYLDFDKPKYLVYSFISFFLALLSKESAIPFLVIIPLTLYFFSASSLNKKINAFIPLLISILLFIIIRQRVLGSQTARIPDELMNNSFLHTDIFQKYATIVYTLGVYLKLLFIPQPLTFDYYPYHIHIMSRTDYKVVISLILSLFLIIIAILGLRKKWVISFCIIFYLALMSIISNIFFPIGTFMSERFLYSSSLPFCIIIAWLLVIKFPVIIKSPAVHSISVMIFIFVVLLLFSIKTISRNMAWKDDFTLFTTDVITSFDGAKSNTSAGGKLTEAALLPENKTKKDEYLKLALKYLNRAVKIHPSYTDALLLLGNAYYEYEHNYDSTLYYYYIILDKNPYYNLVYSNIEKIFLYNNDVDYKFTVYKKLFTYNRNDYNVNYHLGSIYGRYRNDIASSIFYLDRAVKLNPRSNEANKDLGVAYGIKGEFDKSVFYLEQASKIDPNDAEVFLNLSISWRRTGNIKKSDEYLALYTRLSQSAKKQ